MVPSRSNGPERPDSTKRRQTDDLCKLGDFIDISRRTHAILVQNIALALGIKAGFFVLALMGLATLSMAVFADMGASLIVVFNGLRMLRRDERARDIGVSTHGQVATNAIRGMSSP